MITKEAEPDRERVLLAIRRIKNSCDLIGHEVVEETRSAKSMKHIADELERAFKVLDNINLY
jgi:hypothetical protein